MKVTTEYATVLVKKEIKILNLALIKAKETGDYKHWSQFIRTRESNVTWLMNIRENGFMAVRRSKRLTTNS